MGGAGVCLLALALPLAAAAGLAQQIAKAPAAIVVQPAPQDEIPVLIDFSDTPPANPQERITRELRHRLVMLPEYSIFDWLAFRVNGSTVEVLGEIYSDRLKDKAVQAVEQVPGIEHVIDQMKLLPFSESDNRIRRQESSAIYGQGSLSQYLWSARPSIHIVVNGGQVWLEGEVDNRTDWETAAKRAQGVEGVVRVTNQLAIVAH